MQFLVSVALLCFVRSSSARALWVPPELEKDAAFWAAEDFTPLARRDDTCGGLSDFDPCGDGFPSDFCCSTGTVCLALNTTSTIQAALCCPAGQDCQIINPIKCDITLQNATLTPNSQLHSQPPADLQQCDGQCCPMGFACQGNVCKALTAEEAATSSTASASGALPTTTSDSASSTSTAESTNGVRVTSVPVDGPVDSSSADGFSGKSFAAGFLPGIAIGALLAAGLIMFMLRRGQRKSRSYVNEKHHSSGHDTLTDLGPEVPRRPTVHGRSISEPTVDLSLGHRTDFLKYTPPHNAEPRLQNGMQGYVVNVRSAATAPVTPADPNGHDAPQSSGWLSRSPFPNQAQTPIPTQSPVPTHMKRGTLSFHVSPIRALKKQKSVHSLRRQMTDLSARSNSSTRRNKPEVARSDSTETIKVLMDTPVIQARTPASTLPSSTYRPQQTQPPASTATWETTDSTTDSPGSTPIEEEPSTYTPTRPGRNSKIDKVGATLNSPYTPSNYNNTKPQPITKNRFSSLMPPTTVREGGAQNTRDSTFSALMEKVGLRKTLLMGPDPRDWNKG